METWKPATGLVKRTHPRDADGCLSGITVLIHVAYVKMTLTRVRSLQLCLLTSHLWRLLVAFLLGNVMTTSTSFSIWITIRSLSLMVAMPITSVMQIQSTQETCSFLQNSMWRLNHRLCWVLLPEPSEWSWDLWFLCWSCEYARWDMGETRTSARRF